MKTIDLETLIEQVDAAKRKLDVCVPCTDYYRRRDDWSETTIEYVDADTLICGLKALADSIPSQGTER